MLRLSRRESWPVRPQIGAQLRLCYAASFISIGSCSVDCDGGFRVDLICDLEKPTDFRLRTADCASEFGLRAVMLNRAPEMIFPVDHSPFNQGFGQMSNNNLFAPNYQEFGRSLTTMASRELTKDEIVRKRTARGWSQKRLAAAVGVRQNTIAQIEKGTTKKSKYLPDIARILDDPETTSDEPALTIPQGKLVGARDLPLFAAVEAGDGMMVMSSDPIGEERRPAPLENVRGGFGLIVVGESMAPVLRPGDTLLVNPHLPPRVDDVVVFTSERDGQMWATVKEYLGQTKDHWKVKRYRPQEREYTLKKADWRVHGVMVGKYTRR